MDVRISRSWILFDSSQSHHLDSRFEPFISCLKRHISINIAISVTLFQYKMLTDWLIIELNNCGMPGGPIKVEIFSGDRLRIADQLIHDSHDDLVGVL